jgi:TolB-like protein
MSDVFVSYKAEDRRRVKPLVDALESDGYSVWWDAQIGGGAQWRHMIEAELNAAKCVLVAWSKRSVGTDGTFVQDEATRAQERHVYIPVLLDKVHLPLGFGEMQALPLSAWRGDRSDPHYQAILAAVTRIAGESSGGAKPHFSGPALSRRRVLAGGGVAAVAVAGAGGWALLKPAAASANGSIAVLPFANLSDDPAQAYFSDGIAEEIRSALTRIAGLKVAGSTSSEAVRKEDAQTAAKKLDVTNILTGSVRQSPSTIRVTAELIDGKTGIDRWSQDYDRSPGDSIKIQTDIAENVANALSAALGGAALAAIAVGGTSNPAAQKLYLQAKAQLHADDSENGLHSTNDLLDSAIESDPRFANAYALKARTLATLNGFFTPTGARYEPGYIEAEGVARRAISLAPDLAAGHMVLGYIKMSQLDVGGAAVEYQRGHALAGGGADDLLDYGGFLGILGRMGEGLDVARQAQRLDPLNPAAYLLEGGSQSRAGHLPQAVAAYRKALALAPNLILARALLGWDLMNMGKVNEARAEFGRLQPDYLFRLVGEAILFARQGNRAASDEALKRAQQKSGDGANYQYAEVYAQRGEKEKAFAALERAWEFRDPGLAFMKTDPWFYPLRADGRFAALLKKMNFPA